MGSGYYANSPLALDHMNALDTDDIAREIVDEFAHGVDATGVHPGIIGELGCSWPLTAAEVKGLQAGVIAQHETGAAINIHPGRNDRAPLEILDILAAEGADFSRVVMSHMDRCGYARGTREELLASGCFIEYDLFGFEGYYPARVALAEGKLPETPNDTGRVKEIREHIEEGYAAQLLLSHDIGMKVMLVKYGGWGYAHILREVVPLMKLFGITQAEIDTMMVDNPRRLLSLR
jgi:phosphotriesterase-related protein